MSTELMPTAPMLTDRPEWQALRAERATLADTAIRDLFAQEPQRAMQYAVSDDGMRLEYGCHRATAQTLEKLVALAQACGLEGWRDRMFAGDTINSSENRAVLHTALRRPRRDSVIVNGENVMPFVHDVLDRMEKFTAAVHDGTWRGHSGKPVDTVVNIGIGGSDLGPRMACHALRAYHRDGIRVHFVSNVDGADIEAVLRQCDPHTTLFLVASKTFTTSETMTNAGTARRWLLGAHHSDAAAVARHFVALSTNEKAVADFGIAASNMFPFRDWVGGRYSLWSAIGLPIALCVGFDNFRALLAGAYSMDRHFATAPLAQNMPVVMALLGLWYRNFWDAQSYAVIPYSRDLTLLPAWLQQLDMESNGKAVTRDGRAVTYDTGPVVFGAPGTDSQHAFFQLIHQGTSLIPVDFIAPLAAPSPHADHHRILLANMRAQAQALMQGRPLAESGNDPQKVFTGNRPSSTLTFERLDPYYLGKILALYEHKVFVQGIIWNINSFDQWGVELGKILAQALLSGEAA
jgi:glucose-6-phosphate isomerase